MIYRHPALASLALGVLGTAVGAVEPLRGQAPRKAWRKLQEEGPAGPDNITVDEYALPDENAGYGGVEEDHFQYKQYHTPCGGLSDPCCDYKGKSSCRRGLGCAWWEPYPQCRYCGDEDEPCCQPLCIDEEETCSNGQCGYGLFCNPQNQCKECGNSGTPPCDGKCFGRKVIGGDGLCTRCGQATDPCCRDNFGNSFCNPGSTCVGTRCQVCGDSNQACCTDNFGNRFCDDDHNCVGTECEECGGDNQPCCTGRPNPCDDVTQACTVQPDAGTETNGVGWCDAATTG